MAVLFATLRLTSHRSRWSPPSSKSRVSWGSRSVAEYVQDEASMALLKDLGVTWGQGFLLGAPEPFAEKLNSLTLQLRRASILA